MGDYLGDYSGVIKGDTRSIDHSLHQDPYDPLLVPIDVEGPPALWILRNSHVVKVCVIFPETWVLPPLSNNWILNIMCYIALNMTPNIDCYWVGAVPNLETIHRTAQQQRPGPILVGLACRTLLVGASLLLQRTWRLH